MSTKKPATGRFFFAFNSSITKDLLQPGCVLRITRRRIIHRLRVHKAMQVSRTVQTNLRINTLTLLQNLPLKNALQTPESQGSQAAGVLNPEHGGSDCHKTLRLAQPYPATLLPSTCQSAAAPTLKPIIFTGSSAFIRQSVNRAA